MIVKCHLGLGDAVYSYAIIEHLLKTNKKITVQTKYPLVFKDLPCDTTIEYGPFDLWLRYTHRRKEKTTQFQDMCISAKIKEPLKIKLPKTFKYDSKIVDYVLNRVDDSGRKLAIIKEPCAAHMDKKNDNLRFAPDVQEVQDFVNKNKLKYFFVSVGKDEVFKGRIKGIDFDLNNKLTVSDLLYLCQESDIIASQTGHLIPIAQAFNVEYKLFTSGRCPIPLHKL